VSNANELAANDSYHHAMRQNALTANFSAAVLMHFGRPEIT
jgi:hypothetical protein